MVSPYIMSVFSQHQVSFLSHCTSSYRLSPTANSCHCHHSHQLFTRALPLCLPLRQRPECTGEWCETATHRPASSPNHTEDTGSFDEQCATVLKVNLNTQDRTRMVL